MKKNATIILLFVAIAISLSACNNNEPSNASDEKLSHEDSLVFAYKNKLIGDTTLIWWEGGTTPNITTFAVLYKFKKDSVLCAECGWLGYDGNDENHFSFKDTKKLPYDIKIDDTGWNTYLKIGENAQLFKIGENDYPSYFKYGNKRYVRGTSTLYDNIDHIVRDFMKQ